MDTELDIQQFFQKVENICTHEQALQKERHHKGENYNLFSILRIEASELKHSALIANLLDPKGSHGCGDAFLRAFFEIALKGTAYPFESSTPPDSCTERDTGPIAGDTGGRIDILVKSSHYGLIIENKIYAGDQDKQLTRYDNYGKKTFGADRYLLVYLTLFGSEASEGSTAKGNAKEVDYLCLSYAEDILRWLEQCVRLADNKPLVRESLNQYIRTIKQLTYQDMNQENIQKIIDLAVDHPEVVDILSSKRGAIAQGIREKYIFPKLEEYAKKKGCIFINKTDSNKLSEIRIQKDGWDGYIIISSESGKGPRWTNVWIGVKDNRPSEIKSPSQAQTDEGNGMKWKYLNPYNWESPENFPAMKTSVAEEIINKLDEIIKELGFK